MQEREPYGFQRRPFTRAASEQSWAKGVKGGKSGDRLRTVDEGKKNKEKTGQGSERI